MGWLPVIVPVPAAGGLRLGAHASHSYNSHWPSCQWVAVAAMTNERHNQPFRVASAQFATSSHGQWVVN
jgi:hypothetical protein